ncbi:MAG: DegV family protein [Candidatus Cryosericum sp.]|nr:DegV family protein [bacterium]
MAIHIVTDSMACLPQEYVQQHKVTVVPLKVSLDGVYYRDGIDITNDEFYRRLVAGAKGGSTQPSPEEFTSAYGAILQEDPAGKIVSLHVSSHLSGTLNSAQIGRNEVGADRVHLVDTLNAGLGIAFPVMRAVELAEAGASVEEVVAGAEALVQRTHTYFVVDSFTYIAKGGRIGKAAVVAASILRIKPILTFTQGVTDVADRPRTKKVAMEHLWAIIDRYVQKGIYAIGFQYGTNRAEVESFQREFTSRYGLPSIVAQIEPVLGNQVGPEILAAVIAEKESH